MSEKICISCRRPKATHPCELCSEWSCKSCGHFLDADTFSFREKVASELKHTYYCAPCFQAQVEPELETYREMMVQAEDVYIFFTSQKKSIPLVSKAKESIRVENCEDRDQTILRLAFKAVEQGHNAVMETHVVSEKVRNAGHQKNKWSGTGIPATVDAERIERHT